MTDDDLGQLIDMLPVDGASDLQMEAFVLRQNGVTRWGMLRQALAEVKARRAELVKCDGANAADKASARRVGRLRKELAYFEGRARGLAEELDIDPRDDDALHELECETWMVKLTRRALIERVCRGVPDTGTVDAMMSLPSEQRDQALRFALTTKNPAAALFALYERGEIVEISEDGTLPLLSDESDVGGANEAVGSPLPNHAS